MNLANAQRILWEELFELEATGTSGFEGFLAAVLRDLTEQAFRVVKAGAQGGSDVRSDPCNLVRIALESKQYGRKTRLSVDVLLRKLTEASRAEPPPDLWILASTREIDSIDREKLAAYGDDLGIGVAVWDWPGEEDDQLCDLAVVSGKASSACKSYLRWSTELGEALEIIRSDGDFESRAADWCRRLVRPDVGFASGRERCWQWLEDAQGSLPNANSRLGGHNDLRSNRYGVVRRFGINQKLQAWFSDRTAGLAALVGDEGMGKSWGALDWCDQVVQSRGPESPIIVFLPARLVKGTDAKSDIARSISKQTGVLSEEFWRRRLGLWEKSGREGVRVLVVVDGLNQNFLFQDWADWAQPLLEDSVRSVYSLLVTCRRTYWRDDLLSLSSLEPRPLEIAVTRFNDEELDRRLEAMDVSREHFADDVLPLMRVPRLSAVALEKRAALADSADITAERVIYEDWKDRIHRGAPWTGLDDGRMKAFVEELGRQLREDVDRAISRRNIMEILSHKSGRTGEELQAAVAQLTSGGWFKEEDGPDTFKLEPDRVHYVLGAALVSELKRNHGSVDVGGTIAGFLDPLRAHSLGARILRAATTIALVEEHTAQALKRILIERWLDEENFSAEDFDALWRLAGLDAQLFLEVAEGEWLAARASGFKDEVLIKALANAAEFANFNEVLKSQLVKWLGTAWPEPSAGRGQKSGSDINGFTVEGKESGIVRSRLEDWLNTAPGDFASVRLREEAEWDWLGQRAMAVISYTARAPNAVALEAWALSRSLMERPEHLDDLSWVLRMNTEDPDEAYQALGHVVDRLEEHRHPTSRRAASHLRKAMSHTQRGDRVPEVDESNLAGDREAVENDEEATEGEVLFEAVEAYLGPEGWKRRKASAGAALIDALIKRGFATRGKEIDLLSNRFREVFTIIAPPSRPLLGSAFERAQAAALAGQTSQPREAARFGIMSLILRLFDASAEEQTRLLFASEFAPMGPEWRGICHAPQPQDLEGVDLATVTPSGLQQWLVCVGQRLDKALIQSLEFLPSLVTSEDVETRWRAVELAVHGRNVEALRRFAASEYASPTPDGEREFFEEHARNLALLTLELVHPGTVRGDWFADECAALKVMHGDDSDSAMDGFSEYLAQELTAVTISHSWSTRRYWYSYLDCVKSLMERMGKPEFERLARLTENAAHRADWALMNDFPVLDTMRALKETAPEAALEAFQALKEGVKRSILSKEAINAFPFELPRSEASDTLCEDQLDSALTDKELFDIVYFCHKNGRVDWLLERVTFHEKSERPADVAKAFTLLGCCDTGSGADALWDTFNSRPPEDEWLRQVFRESRNDYCRNRRARAALKAFWRDESDAVARHAWKFLEQDCDRRIGLWLKEMEPATDDLVG